ncbi:MAG: zinc ribbon domain-containing protein [Deltaproteobacteria bacterium]|nr:zinc ribbon domain-containing protein [Deltaproteobacteria bacterium]
MAVAKEFEMPTYTYMCDNCNREFEIEQRISDPPLERCPKCRKKKAHRVITNGNFILKGGGWYCDGYSSKNGDNGPSSSKHDSTTKAEAPGDKKACSTSSSTGSAKASDSTTSSNSSVSAA